MEPFKHTGVFWLPDTPDRQARGDLTWDGTEITVTLREPLVAYTDTGAVSDLRWTTLPVVHGDLHGQSAWAVTLLDVTGWGFELPAIYVEVGCTAGAAVMGAYVEPPFSTVAVKFDLLSAWVQPSSVLAGKQGGLLLVNPETETISETEAGDLHIRLVGANTVQAGLNSLSVSRSAQVEITGPPSDVSVILEEWVRPLQDLAIVSIGQPVEITHLRVARRRRIRSSTVNCWFPDLCGQRPKRAGMSCCTALILRPCGTRAILNIRSAQWCLRGTRSIQSAVQRWICSRRPSTLRSPTPRTTSRAPSRSRRPSRESDSRSRQRRNGTTRSRPSE